MEREGREGREGGGDGPLQRKADCPPHVEDAARCVITAALEVHTHLGPGMLESLYEEALAIELVERGMAVERQAELTVEYKGHVLRGQRLDLVVERCLIVELKAIAALQDVHKAQLLSYLRAARLPLGLLINFHVLHLRDGIRRVLNERALSPSRPSRPSRSNPGSGN